MVERARRGDREAFGWLFERHREFVWRFSWRLCRGDRDRAEELVQDAFFHALRGIEAFRGESRFTTWLYRIVLNVHVGQTTTTAARARRRHLSIGTDRDDERPALDVAAPAARPDDLAAHAELLARLRSEFDRLDEPRRLVVLLRDVEGRSYEEIASLLGLPIGTVRSRLARAREQLARSLGERWFRGAEGCRDEV